MLVLSAYALPALTIDVDSHAETHPFRFWHGVLMVPTIPPVVCSLLVCYALVSEAAGSGFDLGFDRSARAMNANVLAASAAALTQHHPTATPSHPIPLTPTHGGQPLPHSTPPPNLRHTPHLRHPSAGDLFRRGALFRLPKDGPARQGAHRQVLSRSPALPCRGHRGDGTRCARG